MYRASMLAMLVPNDLGVDKVKLMKMALAHDLCESISGDITMFCGVTEQEKHDREKLAMQEIQELLPNDGLGAELMDLWLEYEKRETIESVYMKDIDIIEMIFQADEYERTQNLKLCTFFETSAGKVKTDFFKAIESKLRADRISRMIK